MLMGMAQASTTLVLCSHFSAIASALPFEVAGKKVSFIATASLHEEYKGYVEEARSAWRNLGAEVIEAEISTMPQEMIDDVISDADFIYLSGGNTFFLINQLNVTGAGATIKKMLTQGAVIVGESAGAIVCGPDLKYIEPMDSIPEDVSLCNFAGLGLIDAYIVPHYLEQPFLKASQQIVTNNPHLPLQLLKNNEMLVVKDAEIKRFSA